MSKNEPFAPWQCPLCGEKLTGDSTLKCTKGHCFDRAKEGYWHLLPVQSMRTKAPGDSKEMPERKSRLTRYSVSGPSFLPKLANTR